MISLTPILTRLKNKPTDFKDKWFITVEGAAEYARRKIDNLPLPALWLVREGDRVKHAGERTEETTFSFDIVIAISNLRSHAQGDTDDLLLTYREAVKNLLLGWRVEGGETDDTDAPLKWCGGQVIEYAEGDLFWRDRYEFTTLITNYLPDPDSTNDFSNVFHEATNEIEATNTQNHSTGA